MRTNRLPPWWLYKLVMFLNEKIESFKVKLWPSYLVVMDHISGSFKCQIIKSAIELNIPDLLLKKKKNIDELASLTKANKDALYRLLRALCALNVFKKDHNGYYKITSFGKILTTNGIRTMRNHALIMSKDWYNGLSKLTDAVKTGEKCLDPKYKNDFFKYLESNPETSKIFNESMVELALPIIPAIFAEYDFSNAHNIVDIGGGYGHLLDAILRKYPHINGTVFDRSLVIDKAKNKNNHKNRCNYVSGDFFKDYLPNGDLYILKSVINDWDDEHAIKILSHCRESISNNSKLLIIEPVLNENEINWFSLFIDILMLAMFNGKERDKDQFEYLLNASNFKLNRIIKTRSAYSIIEAEPI